MPLLRGKCAPGPLCSSSGDKASLPTFVKIISTRKKLRTSLGHPPHKANAIMEAMAMGNRIQGEVCLLQDSPFRILRAAESGNVDLFGRLYAADPDRLALKDNRGRTATHQAAERNKTQILRFVFAHGGDINIKDDSGNTPLHVAVEYEALDSIGYLVEHGADTSILNDKKLSPLHLATEMNKLTALSVMARYKDHFDTQLGGDHGRTALHLAAIHDYDECARILIQEFGGCPRRPCNNGFYPIHDAAKNASSRTMEVFLEWGESRGCPREEMISFYDAEGNVPLHSAVHGGDIKAVELCLKSGAKISTQQQNLSTPVHLACAQGALEIVRLMFSMQPKEKDQCLSSRDAQKMTPIHCAAMFDHVDMVEFLVKEGADVNAVDREKRSALLLAASHSAWRTVHALLNNGADICLRDKNQHNALHLIIMNGGRLEDFLNQSGPCFYDARRFGFSVAIFRDELPSFAEQFTSSNIAGNARAFPTKRKSEACLRQLLNEKDSAGCSPLHYACRDGYIRSLANLIRLGASVNLKNNKNESALHFAARYGRYHIAWQLLDSEKGTFIINEGNGEGMTPLHIASQQGHGRVVQLLLNKGALLQRDHNGRNPLMLAAMGGYTQTMELLFSVHSHLLDQVDKDGNSSLHLATMENKPNSISLLLSMGCKLIYNNKGHTAVDYAIYYKFPEAALAMVIHEQRDAEVLALRSNKYSCIILALIASMPQVFEAVLDKAITKANCKKDSKEFYAMVIHGRVELLSHPLCQKYMQVKWNSYGKYFHMANLFFYIIFLALVTSFIAILLTNQPFRTQNMDDFNGTVAEQLSTINITSDLQKTPMTYCIVAAIVSYIAVNSIREGLQAYQQQWQYLFDPFNIVSWILYTSTLAMVSPVFGADLGEQQFSWTAITVFLSWFNLLSYLQRFDYVGIYVVMFLEVLQTLIKVLLVFSILIIAFGLSFYILLSQGKHLSFSNIPLSLMRTFSMMLGEIDFRGTFVLPYFQADGRRTLPYGSSTFLILGIFMVFMPILIMNLLIGLAVGDIESVRRNAQLKRLAMQVVQHTRLERKLPKMFLGRVNQLELIEYPNVINGKLGFLETSFKKWFCNQFPESCPDSGFETSDDMLTERLEKQKRQLSDISLLLDRQHTLIRLIVQKMEIKTEADDVDEGPAPAETSRPEHASKWASPRLRSKLQAAIAFGKTQSS